MGTRDTISTPVADDASATATTASLSVRCRTLLDDAPVPGITVQLVHGEHRTAHTRSLLSNDAGDADFYDVPRGRWSVVVHDKSRIWTLAYTKPPPDLQSEVPGPPIHLRFVETYVAFFEFQNDTVIACRTSPPRGFRFSAELNALDAPAWKPGSRGPDSPGMQVPQRMYFTPVSLPLSGAATLDVVAFGAKHGESRFHVPLVPARQQNSVFACDMDQQPEQNPTLVLLGVVDRLGAPVDVGSATLTHVGKPMWQTTVATNRVISLPSGMAFRVSIGDFPIRWQGLPVLQTPKDGAERPLELRVVTDDAMLSTSLVFTKDGLPFADMEIIHVSCPGTFGAQDGIRGTGVVNYPFLGGRLDECSLPRGNRRMVVQTSAQKWEVFVSVDESLRTSAVDLRSDRAISLQNPR